MVLSVRLRKIYLLSFLISFIIYHLSFIIFPSPAFAAAPSVTTYNVNSQQIGRYQKFEATFQISKTYPADSFLPYYYYDPSDTPSFDPGRSSPYGVDGISIDARFTAPSGREFTVPAFYYQDYFGNGAFSWKLRFAPEEIGQYSYYLTIADKEGTTRYPASGTLNFTSVNSNSRGFVRVSKTDPRFLAFDNGESFIPMASGKQWWRGGSRAQYYVDAFNEWGQNGINFTRIWDQNDSYGLTVEGHFDSYKYPDDFNPVDTGQLNSIKPGTQMNQRGNQEEDQIIEAAEKNGVYIQLCAHGDAYWIWDGSIYNSPDGAGFDFSSMRHVNYWKRNFRYRVARWGYSTSILAWEAWNEHGHITSGSDVWNFYQTYGQYQKQTDPYQHLRTTSQGSQAYSPGFWSSPAMDLANYHDYMMISRYDADLTNDEVNFVQRFAWCLGTKNQYCSGLGLGDGSSWSGEYKPWVWGELDVGTSDWNVSNPKTKTGGARVRMLHNTTWAGLFSPMGTSPIDWYYDQEDSSTTQARYTDRKAAAAFFKDLDYAGGKFTYLTTSGYPGETISSSNSQIRIFGMKRADKKAAYLWLVNKDSTWNNYPNSPAVSTNTSVTGLLSDTYKVQIWDTYSGQIVSESQLAGPDISLSVSQNNPDAAVKIEIGSGLPTSVPLPTSPPQPTLPPQPTTSNPSPTATSKPAGPTPTISIGTGDADGDGKVDFGDILVILNNWLKNITGIIDQFGDGKINSFDFAVVAGKLPIPTAQPTTSNPSLSITNTPSLSPTSGPSPTPWPTFPPSADAANEWSQFGHDAQRTGFTAQTVPQPWKLAWQWNGSDANGKYQTSHLFVPHLIQPITGAGKVYMIAENTVFALDRNTGVPVWTKGSIGNLVSTPVYSEGFLYVTSSDGHLYQLEAGSGNVVNSFDASNPLTLAPLLAGDKLYVVSENGILFSLDKNSLNKNWEYQGGSPGATPPAYSTRFNTVVFNTRDLYVHAVNASTGQRIWRVKPTSRNYEAGLKISANGAQFEGGWPVIADTHGIVFVRILLDWDAIFRGPVCIPNQGCGAFPGTNSEIIQFLSSHPNEQNLYALNISDGSMAFLPAVGYNAAADGGEVWMSAQPVIKIADGKEVAYMYWRNVNNCPAGRWCDGRWDAGLGEMALEGNQAGYLRYLKFEFFPGDEIQYITMSGNTLFNGHWLVNAGATITDRSTGLGESSDNPIKTVSVPYVAGAQSDGGGCGFSPSHFCSSGLTTYGANQDYERTFPSGFYEYYHDWCFQHGSCLFSTKDIGTSYTIVSDNLVLARMVDGGLMALTNGSPTARNDTLQAKVSESKNVLGSTTVPIKPGDAINYLDETVIVEGTVSTVANHLPKAYYIYFNSPDQNSLQLRIFAKDVGKFTYNPTLLKGKNIRVEGRVTLYVPGAVKPEIIVSDPRQISVVGN